MRVEPRKCDISDTRLSRFGPARADPNSHAVEQSCTDPTCHNDNHGHDHWKVFSTWSYETDQTLTLEALRETMRKLPGTVYRAKGVVYTSDAPQRRAVPQVVGRRVDISLQDEWGGRTPRKQVVIIGTANRIDPATLGDQFDMTAAPNRRAGHAVSRAAVG